MTKYTLWYILYLHRVVGGKEIWEITGGAWEQEKTWNYKKSEGPWRCWKEVIRCFHLQKLSVWRLKKQSLVKAICLCKSRQRVRHLSTSIPSYTHTCTPHLHYGNEWLWEGKQITKPVSMLTGGRFPGEPNHRLTQPCSEAFTLLCAINFSLGFSAS